MKQISRREFLKTMIAGSAALGLGGLISCSGDQSGENWCQPGDCKDVVSVVRIQNDDIDYAVREAIDLLGGIQLITLGKERIMLKPNLVGSNINSTTKSEVIDALARLMLEADKDVSIGEGSAAAEPNIINGTVCSTKDISKLNEIQQIVFDTLGYTDLADSLGIPLINLHTGDMGTVPLENGLVFDEISLHQSLIDIDMLCSVPMMKTHGLANVTLGMKNLIGVYPGSIYGTVRSEVHSKAALVEPSGTASAIVDIARANKLGLVVIDGSIAMEGQGPSRGELIKMDLIIAGTNPLATDMIGAFVMGFVPEEISTFIWAWQSGMTPTSLYEIEVRGASLYDVRRNFSRPTLSTWDKISGTWGMPC